LSMLIIETDAVFSDEAFFDYLSSKNDKRIKIIAEINGFDADTYARIHSSSNFDLAYKNIIRLKEILGKESVYVQIQKIKETETFLDKYYDFWEKEDFQIILMKQNTYLGLLENRKYYDLSPIERTPCWHLQRDLFILADGRVPFCRQEIDPKSADSVSENSLREIWNKRKKYFIDNYKKNYPSSPDCFICDEWYSFFN
ncbi:MAG TPA: SPASM domain-containing protein, partial [Spirochaetota bacterium]|nr:SPASM domain-containing protein [Spirochaetota bacterium]